MRQSQKRGMMNQTAPDPDQPGAAAAQAMSKNMMYIAPFFALTGLYWQFGLVLYWVTTNIWTLGQQHFLFRNLPVVGSATVGASATQAASGTSAGAKNASGAAAKTGTASAKSGTASARAGTAAKSGAAKAGAGAKSGAKPAADGSKPANSTKPASKSGPSGPSGTSRSATASANGAAANGTSNGSGLLRRFGKKEEPQDDVPVAPQSKVVRQQPVRQARSKRGNTGKR
jgi:hypothetical protein